MARSLSLLIAVLFAGAANAQLQSPPPDPAAVEAFVYAIDHNFYISENPLPFYDEPINLAAFLYLAGAPIPGNNSVLDSLLTFDMEEIYDFNYYWVAAGSSASLSDPRGIFFGNTLGVDTPPVVARLIIEFTNDFENNIYEAGTGQFLQGTGDLSIVGAPEIDPSSAASGLTLLFGALMVFRGRRRVPHASRRCAQE
jgi:hypothetical protein